MHCRYVCLELQMRAISKLALGSCCIASVACVLCGVRGRAQAIALAGAASFASFLLALWFYAATKRRRHGARVVSPGWVGVGWLDGLSLVR